MPSWQANRRERSEWSTRETDGVRSAGQAMRNLSSLPRLSIGLPVYNGERFLGEALDSLLGQTYEDFELIISDNASTDGTADICLRYAEQDSRIRYVRQPRNIGLIPNHDFVMEEARGELFKCAAYDDLYGRELLERCVEALDADPDAVLAHSWSVMIDESGAYSVRSGTRSPWTRCGHPIGFATCSSTAATTMSTASSGPSPCDA